MKISDKDALNYSRICEGKQFYYSICENGMVLKTSKIHYKESKVSVFLKNGKATVKINGKMHTVKHLVAKHFIKGYKKGDNVINDNGNPFDCTVKNLKLISKHDLGKTTGHLSKSQKIIVNGVNYDIVRKCAKALFVSYQTVLDYISGDVKNSVLNGYEISVL